MPPLLEASVLRPSSPQSLAIPTLRDLPRPKEPTLPPAVQRPDEANAAAAASLHHAQLAAAAARLQATDEAGQRQVSSCLEAVDPHCFRPTRMPVDHPSTWLSSSVQRSLSLGTL